jgi:hypothetical protein
MTVDRQLASVGSEWKDDIERIKFHSPYVKVTGFEHEHFQGRRVELMCGDWELIGDPENEISSIRTEYVTLGDEVYCGTREQSTNRWSR